MWSETVPALTCSLLPILSVPGQTNHTGDRNGEQRGFSQGHSHRAHAHLIALPYGLAINLFLRRLGDCTFRESWLRSLEIPGDVVYLF